MAFTDLDEHIAEIFGTVVAEDQHTTSLQSQRGSGAPRGYRTTREKHRVEHERRKRRAIERFMAEVADGTRPTTCRGPSCCNLLLPQRGAILECCSGRCRKAKQRM
jgi:hypothetical protein